MSTNILWPAAPAVLGRALAEDVTLVTLPLFHIGGQWAGIYNSLIAGGSSVVLPRFSATTYWDDVRRYGCTYKPDCDREATTTVVINGQARAVCEECRRHELRLQNAERARQEEAH